jgi:hypothetical protein
VFPSSAEKAPNLLDPFGASLPEDENRAGFLKLEDEKRLPSPSPSKNKETVGESYTIVKAL